MPVRVAEKNLPRPVRTRFGRTKIRAHFSQVIFPRLEVFHPQREVIVPAARFDRFVRSADEMQLLLRSQPEPRAGKIKRRARHRFQPQHAGIKRAASRHVRDVKRHVVEFVNLHARVFRSAELQLCAIVFLFHAEVRLCLAPGRAFVAQVSNLLYRRFQIGRASPIKAPPTARNAGGLETREKADWKSAPH